MITSYYATTGAIYRLTEDIDDPDGEHYEEFKGNIRGYLEDLAPEYTGILGQTFGSKKFYCSINEVIKVNDKLRLGDPKDYYVRSIQTFNKGRNKHMEIILEEIGENGS